MKYCKKCLTTNLRPGGEFFDGVCRPCQYYDTDPNSQKKFKLKLLFEKIRDSRKGQRNKGDYDCIVGVSGGKDSTRQAHWVRDRLNLRPLIVCCGYSPKQMSNIGARNLSNLINMGFDVIVATPSPKTSAQLSLESFELFGNVCKSTEMALYSTVPRLAIELGINTIFWGENNSLQVGETSVEGVDEFDGNNLRKMNTLSTGGYSWINNSVSDKYKIDHYIYPKEIDFKKAKVQIFFLGPAWDDWSNLDNSTYASLQGHTLRPGDEEETGDISNASMLDEEFTNINMMLKYYKFGFGRATDLVNELIRDERISRDEAIKIVKKYDGLCSNRIIKNYCTYVGITQKRFWEIANNWVNKDLFVITKNRPKPKFKVGLDYEN